MANRTVATIQARMDSTRLPGKVMLPLGDRFVLEHVIKRVGAATKVDDVVVATSTKQANDIIEWCTESTGAIVFRGDESNVLDRTYRAAKRASADEVVRITADCPLIDPTVIDGVVSRRRETEANYATNILKRTFPRGLDVEAFDMESFEQVHKEASRPAQLEHVTLYYRDKNEQFKFANVTSDEVFEDPELQNRTDLRLTLDEATDYRLLCEVFERAEYDETPCFPDVVECIDDHGLAELNNSVAQKDAHDASGD